jgi:MFS family permease
LPAVSIEFIEEFRDNWRVLLVAFVCLLVAFSAPAFAMPFLFSSVIDEFGWTREQATFLASAKYFTGSVVAVIIGRFIDVIGVRTVLVVVSIVGALALISFLWVSNLALYYAAGMLLGVASPGTIVAIKVLISRSFHASQGTAMGLAMLATGIGSIIVPILITFLIQAYGWRNATALMSAGVWLLALPVMIFFLTDKSFTGLDAGDSNGSAAISWNLARQLGSQPRFWLIAAAVFSAGFVDQALTQHQALYFELDLGFAATAVGATYSGIGLIALAGRPLVGALFDRLSVRGVSLAYLTLGAACIVALGALNPFVLGAFLVFRAVGHSAVLLDTPVLAKHTFGLAHIGILLGVYTAVVNLGFALGPWVTGAMFDATGSYVLPFMLCAVVSVFAAAVLVPVRPKSWLEWRQQQGGPQQPGR